MFLKKLHKESNYDINFKYNFFTKMTSINIRKLSHSEMDLYRKPLLPETCSCFPVDKDIDTQQLRKILQRDLDKIRSGAEKDPFSNSITMLALDISRRLEKNLLNYSALEALIQ